MRAAIADLRRLNVLPILRPMRNRVSSVIAVACLGLTACGDSAPRAAAESAHRLLGAILAGDRILFESQIDRPAVREDLRRQMNDVARADALEVDGGPSEFALDRMIGPDAVRLVRAGSGEALTAAPTPEELSRLLKVVDRAHVCLPDAPAGACALTFGKTDQRWRLVGMRAMSPTVAVPAAS